MLRLEHLHVHSFDMEILVVVPIGYEMPLWRTNTYCNSTYTKDLLSNLGHVPTPSVLARKEKKGCRQSAAKVSVTSVGKMDAPEVGLANAVMPNNIEEPYRGVKRPRIVPSLDGHGYGWGRVPAYR